MSERHATQPLKEHEYPILVRITAGLVIALFLYSLYFFPRYFTASKNLKNGEKYLEQNQYDKAIISFERVLEAVPSSKRAKILLAIGYFSDNDGTNDENGLHYLRGITIDSSDWEKISEVIPSEYQQYFTTIEE